MFRKALFLLIILGLVFLLTGCDLIKDIAKGKPDISECLYGTWQLKGGEAFLRATIPVGALDQNSLTFSGGGGAVYYNFKDDGTLAVLASPLMGRFSVKLEQTMGNLDIEMQGLASAKYTGEDDQIQVGETVSNEITYSAVLDGKEMMNSVISGDFLPLFVEPYRTAEFRCSGDSLFLTIVDLPGDIPPIEFVRIKPTPTP